MEKESSKECSVSFLWTSASFSLWNCLLRNLTLFNQPIQRGFWRNLRYILYSMVKESMSLKKNFCIFFPLCEVSQKSMWKSISSRYLLISKKGYKLCMNWRLEFMTINLLLFGCFRKGFITHSFCKRPLYTLQLAKRM